MCALVVSEALSRNNFVIHLQITPGFTVAQLKGPLHVSKRKQEPPLPRPFDLPTNFSPQIMAGLESENLVGHPRTKFITAIANAIF